MYSSGEACPNRNWAFSKSTERTDSLSAFLREPTRAVQNYQNQINLNFKQLKFSGAAEIAGRSIFYGARCHQPRYHDC